MQLQLLHLDDALGPQTEFVARCEQLGARHHNIQQAGSDIRLWGTPATLKHVSAKLEEIFKDNDEPKLCFMGSGDFHHVSALLIEKSLSAQSDPITVIHFDNHPDWVHCSNGMHCGSWVKRISTHPLVEKILTVGVTSKDLKNPEWKGAGLSLLSTGKLELFPYAHAPSRVRRDYGQGASHRQAHGRIHWKTIAQMGEQDFLTMFLSRIPTSHVYITIDKDVLRREDAETNWDQGQMSLDFLLAMVRGIGAKHRIIGADVTGDYSTPHYSGSLWTRLKKKAEILSTSPIIAASVKKRLH